MADVQRVPGQNTDHWDWQARGLCRGVDPEIFFHPHYERGEDRQRRDDMAKSLCQRCPVLQQCRTHALTAREPDGVWGGLTASERHQLLHPESNVHTTADVQAPR